MGEAADADLQLLKAGVQRIERDVDRLDRRLDTYLQQHQARHDADAGAMTSHVMSANESMARSLRHDGEIVAMDKRLDVVETWRAELLGAMGLMRLAFGTSIISGIVTVAAVVALFTK